MSISRRAFTAISLAALASACSRQEAAAPATATGRTRIRFATDWRAEAEHGGFYQAIVAGEYTKRGLDVELIQGGPAVNVPQLLASGAADMGVGSNSFIVMNLAAEGAPVKAVAAAFQKDPQVLMAHPGTGIASIADMKGRPILLSDASVGAFWIWLKAKYGFTDDQVRKYTFNPAPFLADKRAIQQGYVTSEPYVLETEAKMKPEVFLLADNGYPGYACMVLARDQLIASNPDAVRAFVEASAAGWKSYLEGDSTGADALIRKDNPEMRQDVLDQARAKLKSYGVVDSGDASTAGIGVMTDARWKEFFDMASGQGVYPASLDYKKAYTLQFLQPKA